LRCPVDRRQEALGARLARLDVGGQRQPLQAANVTGAQQVGVVDLEAGRQGVVEHQEATGNTKLWRYLEDDHQAVTDRDAVKVGDLTSRRVEAAAYRVTVAAGGRRLDRHPEGGEGDVHGLVTVVVQLGPLAVVA